MRSDQSPQVKAQRTLLKSLFHTMEQVPNANPGCNPGQQQPVPPVLNQIYVPLVGDAVVPADISEADSFLQILAWIGFRTHNQRTSLMDDALSSYDDVRILTERDVNGLIRDYSGRTIADGRIHIGIRRSKRLKALIHWVQNFYRVSKEPTIVGLGQGVFLAALDTTLSRAEVRRTLEDNTDTTTKAADPGPLKSENNGVSGRKIL